MPGYSQPSPLEAILDMDSFTLEEILDEADLIQECKSLNGRLVNFLKEPSTVQSLLTYLVDLPGPGQEICPDILTNTVAPGCFIYDYLQLRIISVLLGFPRRGQLSF